MTEFNKLSKIIENQLPEFIRADHPTFIAFLEAYYEFLEQPNQLTYVQRQLLSSLDVDEALPEFLDYFYKDFLPLIPEDILADRTLLLKHASTFYKARGTEKSFKLLFRILYNETVEIRYPKNNILVASGGKWYQEKALRITLDDVDYFELFDGLRIIGELSNASARVDQVRTFRYGDQTVYQLIIIDIQGNFSPSETVYALYTETNGSIRRLEATVDGGVTEILILEPGTGYSRGDIIRITGGGGNGAIGEVTETSTGRVLDFNIYDGGTGYLTPDVLEFTTQVGDDGSGAAAYISVISSTHQHPSFFNLNSDIIGIYANVAYNAAVFTANLTGTVNIAANSNVIVGTTGLGVSNTQFATQLGANVVLSINGNTSYVYGVANNSHAMLTLPISPAAVTNANVVVSMALQNSNVNTPYYDSLTFNIFYGPCGPVERITSTSGGQDYSLAPTIRVAANQYTLLPGFGYIPTNQLAYIQGAGIVGEVQINSGGINYALDDEIIFTSLPGTIGRNAGGYVSNVAANGAITGITLAYPRIGRAKTNSTSVVVTGLGTTFTTSLTVNSHIIIGSEERQVISIANNTSLNVNSAFTVNTANSRISKRLDFIGGIGYTNTAPPTITVSSLAGANANITLKHILGFGANIAGNTDIGAILATRVINPGSGYTTNAEADMTGLGDGNAELLPTIIDGVFTYPGYYLDASSFLSSSAKLQDRDYYQPYSYVLKSRTSLEQYAEVLKKILHPAGTIGFAEISLDSVLNNQSNVSSFSITTANT